MTYWRPIPLTDPARPAGAPPLAGGPVWFDRVERNARRFAYEIEPLSDVPPATLATLSAPRAPVCGLSMDRVRIMTILNVTPDSFSDGGRFLATEAALAQARAAETAGPDPIDIRRESTRPGAAELPLAQEIARTAPVIAAILSLIHIS